ncbi:hypothetical protein ACFE04_023447 [Oxalis oulophora]
MVTGRYNTEKNCSSTAAIGSVNLGDVRLQATVTDATFVAGPSFSDLSLSVEKPGSFLIDYTVPTKDVRFQFMNTVTMKERLLNFTYTHVKGSSNKDRVCLDGALVIDEANKFAANYALDTGDCKMKYVYRHKMGTTIEPSYDLVKNSWGFVVAQTFYDDQVLKGSFETSTKMMALDWCMKGMKVSAALNLADGLQVPRLSAESTWNLDL